MARELAFESRLFHVVDDWAKYLNRDLGKVIAKKNIGVTHALVRSRKYHIKFNGSMPERVVFEFLAYGKFTDMGVGRGQGIGDVKGNRQIMIQTGLHGRVAKKWYSKTITGEFNTLSNILMDQFGIRPMEIVEEEISTTLNMSL